MKKILALALSLAMILTMAACASTSGTTDSSSSSGTSDTSGTTQSSGNTETTAATYSIKFANNGVSDLEHPQNKAMYYFKDLVEDRSNGQIETTIYVAASLGDARTIMEGVQLGSIEMGDVENGVMSNFVPETAVFDLPYLFDDIDHAHRVEDGEVGQYLQKLYLNIGVRHLAFNDGGFRYFTTSKKPLTDAESFKGMKIRVMQSDVMIKTINAFGAKAVPMAFGELYTALQQGTVDGQENPLDLIYAQSYAEVQDYLSLSEHFYYPRQYIINEDYYQSMPDDLQKIISDAAVESCQYQRECLADYTTSMLGKLKEQGFEVVDFDKSYFQKVSEDLWPDFYETIGNGDAEEGKWLVESIRAEAE